MCRRGGQWGTVRSPAGGWNAGADSVREVCRLRDLPSPDTRPWLECRLFGAVSVMSVT